MVFNLLTYKCSLDVAVDGGISAIFVLLRECDSEVLFIVRHRGLAGSLLDHRALPAVFESRRGHI